MAIDGSFKLESALERFLSRCPALTHHSLIDTLIKKVFCLSLTHVMFDYFEYMHFISHHSICIFKWFLESRINTTILTFLLLTAIQ